MQDRIKEHDRDIRLACTQTSAVRSMLTKRGIFLFGKRLSLLIVTHTGTHVGSKRLSIFYFLLITSIEIVEWKFLKLGYLQSESTTADQP